MHVERFRFFAPKWFYDESSSRSVLTVVCGHLLPASLRKGGCVQLRIEIMHGSWHAAVTGLNLWPARPWSVYSCTNLSALNCQNTNESKQSDSTRVY